MNGILKKLRIKTPHKFLCIKAPAGFEAKISEGAADCTFTTDERQPYDSMHWFVKTKAEVDAETAGILKLLKPGLPVWTYYPKDSSGIQTDLTRDKGWETLLQNPDIRWVALISFDDTWTAFCFRLKTDKDRAEEAKPQAEREIFKYADSKTKTIRLPDDLKAILEMHPAEKALFDALNFSNKREYIEWVITAKQEQTRRTRLEGTIGRLGKGWKNPANR